MPELILAASVVSDRFGRQMIEAFLHLEHADRYRIVSLTERLARDSRSAPPSPGRENAPWTSSSTIQPTSTATRSAWTTRHALIERRDAVRP